MDLRDLLAKSGKQANYSPQWSSTAGMDAHIAGREPQARGVIALTDVYREAATMALPALAGTRVAIGHNLGMVLQYNNLPAKGVLGTVVTVRTAVGDTTTHNGHVFVKWDDGGFFPVVAQHLQIASMPPRKSASQATEYRRVACDLGDLSDFLRVAGKAPDLVHKATKDLWSFRNEGGQFVLERLFDDTGEPLKV